MIKHKGFPSRLVGTDFQFTVRRENKSGASKILRRERYLDRKPADKKADAGFLDAIWQYFGESTFERGNLDAGRLSWFLGREIKSVGSTFDPSSYDTKLVLDKATTSNSFPDIFENND